MLFLKGACHRMDYRKVRHWVTAAVLAMGAILLLVVWYTSGHPEIQPAIRKAKDLYLVIVLVGVCLNTYCEYKSKK